jgi:primosomal protein N' (replication factor Y)
MISKGLDFEKVSIVGIMNADATMNMPDFRAIERSYQLIAQVSGRAGRHGKRGRVYIQTRSIDSPLIANIVKGDFKANLMWQAAERQQYHYPPFYRLIYLTVKHRTEYISRNAAQALAADLRATFGERIIGPQAPMINRIDTYFQQRIMVKMERSASPATIKNIVMDKVNNLLGDQQWRSVQVEIDVDPN